MVAIRVLLAIVTALSVAALPVPAALAHTYASSTAHHEPSSGETQHAADMDCCKGEVPCEKHSGDGCGSMASCLMTCCTVTSVVALPLSTPLKLSEAKFAAIADLGVAPGATAPPLPPPRV